MHLNLKIQTKILTLREFNENIDAIKNYKFSKHCEISNFT